MESWIQRVFLIALSAIIIGTSVGTASTVFAQEVDSEGDDVLEQIITPDIKRRTIKEDDLDSENFEVGIFYGLLGIEDFGTNPVQGINLDYHITEDIFVELIYGISRTQKTSYELLSGGVELLTDDQRDLNYYSVSLGYNFLPGQIFLTENWTLNTRFYLMGGIGNTDFAAKDYFTTSIGAGLRFYTTDWLVMDLSMRGHSFTHELFGEDKTITNLESRIGLSLFF